MKKVTHPTVETQLPLREATFYILLSLVSGPQHGYAILKDVKSLSENRVRLSTGTLYGALKRLLEQGWIERVEPAGMESHGKNPEGPPRKAYMLTDLGHQILEAEADRLEALLAAVRMHFMRGRS